MAVGRGIANNLPVMCSTTIQGQLFVALKKSPSTKRMWGIITKKPNHPINYRNLPEQLAIRLDFATPIKLFYSTRI
jgi:hypothetical protein